MAYFYTSRNGEQEGPLAIESIIEKIKATYFTSADFIYDDNAHEWVSLAVFPTTAEYFLNSENQNEENEKNSWFILKGEEKFGPFPFLDLVRMLQEKNLNEFDFVWNSKMSNWCRVADCEDFSADKMKALLAEQNTKDNNVFFRRRFARAGYSSSLVVHNNLKIWKGECFQISAGGAGLILDNCDLKKGDEIYLHFKPGLKVPPFNSQCEVVALHELKAADGKLRWQLGVRFLKVNYLIQKVINDYVTVSQDPKDPQAA
jgi:hypothetical protein